MLTLSKRKRNPSPPGPISSSVKSDDTTAERLTEAVTPNVYLGDSPLNPDFIGGLQHDVDIAPTVIEKIVKAKHRHLQDRRQFVPVPLPITEEVWGLPQPSNHWWFHLTNVPGWEKWYEVDFNRPYLMTDQQLEALTEGKQRSLLIGWEPGTEVPILIVRWEHNPDKEPSVFT